MTEINQMKQTTILMSIHDINHASRFSDYLLAMKNGKLITEGTPEEVITKECMKKYLRLMQRLSRFQEQINQFF